VNEQALKRADDRLQIPELTRRARLRRLLWLGFIVAAAGLAVAYYSRDKPVVELYRTDRVAYRTIVQLVETTGNVDVRSRVEVPASIAGRLTSIEVAPRQTVKKGQLLATLDERASDLAVHGAQASIEAAAGRLEQAQTAFDAAKRDADHTLRLQSKGLASEQDALEAQTALERAKAALAAARADRKLATQNAAASQLEKSMSRVTAPADGVVLRAPDRIGAAVSPEREPLFVISAPLDVMRVETPVSETEIALIKPGRKAEVLVQALPDRTFNGTVERIGIEPKREGGVALYPVTLLVDNPDGALLPGMSARVRMEVARAEHVLAVHDAALRFTQEGAEQAAPRSRIWLRRGHLNELEAIAVKAGISDGAYTAVEPRAPATLSEGDDVAIGLLHPEQAAGRPSVSLGGQR
jgi:HlyD family secretion protein